MAGRIIVLLFTHFVALSAVEATPPECFPDQKIPLPPQVLQYYLSEPGSLRALPLPQSDCRMSRDRLEILNLETNQKFGVFRHERTVRGAVNEIPDSIKAMDPGLKSIFRPDIESPSSLVKLVAFLNAVVNPARKIDFKNDIAFSIGRMTELNASALGWDPYTPPRRHWAARTIGYEELIQFFADESTRFVHIEETKKYEIPVVNNQPTFISSLNLHQTPTDEVVRTTSAMAPLRPEPIIVVSRALHDWMGHNTITNLYFSGYRNIYWFKNSTSLWRNTLRSEKFDYYGPQQKLLTDAALFQMLRDQKPVNILDLSDRGSFEQVQLIGSVNVQPVYFEALELQTSMKKTLPPEKYELFLKSRAAREGAYFLANPEKFLKSRSPVILTAANHHQSSAALRNLYDQLTSEGHSVSILASSPGGFLSFLRSQGQKPERFLKEKQNLFSKFDPSKGK